MKSKHTNKKPLNSPLISVKNLNFNYSSQPLLRDVSFEIFKGDFVAILGPNGAGKSTLIKLIVKLIETKESKKHITVNGKIAYIPQKFNQDPNFPTTVRELLDLECCACKNRAQIINSLNIENLINQQFKNLSGGQQQRVFVALSLLSEPDILILDEPTIGVDSNTQEEFYKLLNGLNTKQQLTIILITHDTSMVSSYITRVFCIGNHTLIEENLNTSSKHSSVYAKSFEKLHHNHSHHHHH
ncbi:MAG: metal ABC transporter ATP-binding protein [Candidatus Nanoarchaeia archaeon]